MAMSQPPIVTMPWATNGDTAAIPTNSDPSGFVSFQQGYTSDYEILLGSGNPRAKAVERTAQNMLFQIVTKNIQQWQQGGLPIWQSTMPGGYDKNVQVLRLGGDSIWRPYRSLVAANTSDPQTNTVNWAYVPLPSEMIANIPMPAGGSGGSSAEIITVNTDFNTIGNGTYEIKTDAIAAASANSPSSVAGMLEVKVWSNGTVNLTTQRYTDRNGNVFARGASSSTWTSWNQFASLASPTFTGNPLAPTPPQFDNDTSIATTAFVQQAKGSFSLYYVVNSSQTYSAASVGRCVSVSSASATTQTLPLANTCPAGSTLTFASANIGAVTISAQGTDSLYLVGRVGSGNIVLGSADSAVLVSDGVSSWNCVSGSVTLPNAAIMAGANFTTPPQFDNSKKLATTAAVAAVLGNLRPTVVAVSASTTLTVAQGGALVDISVAAGQVITMPAHQQGLTFFLNNYGSNGVTIATGSGGFNPLSGAANPSSFTLQANSSVQVTSDGTNWVLFGGNGSASLASNGYLKFASGVIIAWGYVTASIGTLSGGWAQNNFAWAFPIAFPNAAFVAIGNVCNGGFASQWSGAGVWVSGLTKTTASGAIMTAYQPTSAPQASMIAIGC